ncbi:MAG TPA: mechanosensitive ion channel [Euryarchaeota archaeon]|nr:mechanosensitive ion channel [Euryarchaeota archaeon]
MGKKVNLVILLILSTAFFFVDLEYDNYYTKNGFLTFLTLSIAYIIFKIVLEEAISKQLKDTKARYTFRKIASVLFAVISSLVLIYIWIESTEGFVVAAGMVGAGIAITLQDFFKNFVGGMIIFITGLYHVGDRIEIDSRYGDVIDVGIMYTTLMEIREWVAADQETGRLTTIPNGKVISGIVNNYTKDHSFIWDEMSVPITYDSDLKKAQEIITEIVVSETVEMTEDAARSIEQIGQKYYVAERRTQPAIFLTMTDDWVTFDVRYIVEARRRRFYHDRITRQILEKVNESEDVKIASTTIDITAFPDIRFMDMSKK